MNNSLDKKKVILGLSGGVDSTTAALLLQEQGYEVTGLYFDVTPGNEEGRAAAAKAAEQIGIPFIYKNVNELFENTVIDNFCSEYLAGRTPNPCVYCNPNVKFKVLIDEADRIGAFYIATGHYAKTGENPDLGWMVKCAENIRKDQSYMLYRLPSSTIERLILPLEGIEDKEAVREIARQKLLFNADSKDSQEICFIDDEVGYAAYIFDRGFSVKPGNFIDKEGKVLGKHKGVIHYTIGQRKGLGITFGKPVYVTKLNAANNTVTLGDHEDLFSHEVICGGCFFPSTSGSVIPEHLIGKQLLGKIRYAAKPAECTIEQMEDGRVKAIFTDKQRAATPGQSVVFYYEDYAIGGGYID